LSHQTAKINYLSYALSSQQFQRLTNPDDVPVTKSQLREFYSQDERKSIPVFKGKRKEQLINNWLKYARRKSSTERRVGFNQNKSNNPIAYNGGWAAHGSCYRGI